MTHTQDMRTTDGHDATCALQAQHPDVLEDPDYELMHLDLGVAFTRHTGTANRFQLVHMELPCHLFNNRRSFYRRLEPLPTATPPSKVVSQSSRTPAPPRPSKRRESRHGAVSPGSILEKYRIEEAIGSGAFATVYRATHLLLQMPVAVKLLHKHLVKEDPRLIDLLCDESRFIARLNHPNVVRVYDVTRTDSIAYIVMEWVDGCNLSRLIRRRKRVSQAEVINIGLDLCSGLRAGADVGLVHRDVKPSNILIGKDGSVRIIDLGLARQLSDNNESKNPAARVDAIVGTPGYMAPEQVLEARGVDHRADIFGVGASLYHALAGHPPFDEKRTSDVRQRAKDQILPPPLPDDIDPDLVRCVERMLAVDPDDRPQTYEEVEELLRAIQIDPDAAP